LYLPVRVTALLPGYCQELDRLADALELHFARLSGYEARAGGSQGSTADENLAAVGMGAYSSGEVNPMPTVVAGGADRGVRMDAYSHLRRKTVLVTVAGELALDRLRAPQRA